MKCINVRKFLTHSQSAVPRNIRHIPQVFGLAMAVAGISAPLTSAETKPKAAGTGLVVVENPVSYLDGRPYPSYRLNAVDQGMFLEYGKGPNQCDSMNAREAMIHCVDGAYYLYYDGAGAKGCQRQAADALQTPARKPNIVVFLADDMPWHYPGFNGGPCETPNLDRLAKEGTRLTRFYVHSVCSPTRSALLTGRYPFRNGMEERSHGNDIAGMLPDERTLAQALKPAGYDTALIGKWHLGNWYQRQLPLQRGFDHHYGLYGALISYNGKTRGLWYDWHRDGETIREDGYTTDLFAREFERLMAARNSDKPFFYYVAFNAMHSPYDAPSTLVDKYRKQAATTPGAGKSAPPQELATLESMDTAIGKMIAAMKAKGVLDNTLMVFFNDNGGANENPPFRGGKGSTYEGGVRVPCIIHWPGHVPANKMVDGMVHVTDLYPTLLKLAGGSLEQLLPLDGMDMWEVFTGRKPSPRTEVAHNLPGGGTGEMGEMSICQGSWKLVGKELYDLSNDPAEKTDLAAKHPEIHNKLNDRMQQLVAQRRPPEKHLNIPDKPLLVLGEKENAHPPPWLQPYLDSLPESAKSRKQRQK